MADVERIRTSPRDRLADAALALLEDAGPRSITVTALARRARIKQPNFYAYFKTADDCLAAAAQRVAAELTAANGAAFRRVREAVAEGRPILEASEQYHRELLERLFQRPRLVELYARYRYDESAFGRAMRALEATELERVTGDLVEWATRLGLSVRDALPELRALAEIHISTLATVALALVERRLPDRARAARLLADTNAAGIRALFRRLAT